MEEMGKSGSCGSVCCDSDQVHFDTISTYIAGRLLKCLLNDSCTKEKLIKRKI